MAERTRRWVVGFLMTLDREYVVLIRKNRPEWQAGKLNGVGGKVEPGELLEQAMKREFSEETGLRIGAPSWEQFATLTWDEGVVHFFRGFTGKTSLFSVQTMTDEPVWIGRVHTLSEPGPGYDAVVPNLHWLVPLAAHRDDTYDVIDVVETGTTLRKPGRLDVPGGGV